MKKLNGKFLQIRMNGHTIALSTNCSLNVNTQYASDSKTKDEAAGPSSGDAEWVDWSISAEAIIGVSATQQLTASALLDLQLALTEVDVECFVAADGAAAVPEGDWQNMTDALKEYGWMPYGGKATIESTTANGPQEGKATFSVQLKAAGKLEKITA